MSIPNGLSKEEEWASSEDLEERTLLNHGKTSTSSSLLGLSLRTWFIAALVLTNSITAWAAYWWTSSYDLRTYSQDLEGTSKVFPDLDRTLTRKTFSNHRLNVTSRWSAPPSVEVDHAWAELGVKDQIFLLPGKVGREIGLDPRKHVYAPMGAIGEGREGFGVFVQGMHDLHCLNELRRALYFNKDYYRQFENDTLTPEWDRQSHIRHCLDNVRERLMCTADTAVIPTVWTSQEENYPLFGREHKCHSYEAMMEWFNNWHHSPRGQGIDWTVHLSAPPDAIFTNTSEAVWS